jgi:hypothetical protein
VKASIFTHRVLGRHCSISTSFSSGEANTQGAPPWRRWTPPVGFFVRHQVSALIVVAASLVAVGFFVFERPVYRPRTTTVTVVVSGQHRYAEAAVRAAFAAQRIRLRVANVMPDGTRMLGDITPGTKDDAFLVTLYPPSAKVIFDSSGPKPMFSTRVGNVSIEYGGKNRRVARRVEAAADALRRS